MSFGDRIKQARELKGITRDSLAAQIGVTRSAISNYENEISQPSVDKIIKMISALGVDANFLWQDEIALSPAGAGDNIYSDFIAGLRRLTPENLARASDYLAVLLLAQGNGKK